MLSGSLSEVDSIQEWLGEARQRLTHTLDDKTFEHDTQVASGSTTGDWFILLYVDKKFSPQRSFDFYFFSKKSNESNNLIPIWEGASIQ